MENAQNIIWIVTDQQRYDSLSINGNKNVCTPNLDMLARGGVNITSAVSGYPLCCPFRGSMLTSIYPHRCIAGHARQLPLKQKTIADVFDSNGYDTAYFGKWHVDGGEQRTSDVKKMFVPRERRGGFATWIGYENNNAQFDCSLHGHHGDVEIDPFKLSGYETDSLTDILIQYLHSRQESKQPFFAVLSVQPPHDPYLAPAKYANRHTPESIAFSPNVPAVSWVKEQAAIELSGYYAMIEAIDINVGRIINTMEETRLMDDTHILFFSDHGDMHGSHGQFRKMTPYQEAIHIPFIIGGEKRGSYYEDRACGQENSILINHVDIAPTTLGLCNLPVPDWMEGTDYSGVRRLDKKNSAYPKEAYLQSIVPTGHPDSVNKPWRGIVTSDGYKYVCFEMMDWMLFDLNTDPYEQVNLAHNEMYHELRIKLKKKLQEWIVRTGDSFSLPEI